MSVASQGTDCSLETMLINYAKKIMDKESVIKQRDTNKKLLEDLEGVSEISDDLYNANDAFVANVSETRGFAAALGNRMNAVNEETGRVAQEIEGQNTLITRIDHEKKSKNYYVASEKRDRVKADMEERAGEHKSGTGGKNQPGIRNRKGMPGRKEKVRGST